MRIKKSIEVWLYQADLKACLLLKVQNPQYTFWQPITGGIKTGESSAAAAAREVFEETSIHLPPKELIPLGNQEVLVEDGNLLLKKKLFLGITKQSAVQVAPAEHQDYLWVPLNADIEKYLYWPNNKANLKLVKNYLQHKKNN